MAWPPAGLVSKIALFSVLFLGVVLLQWRGNAFQSELGAHADEPAHYITGLMVRDYVAAGFPGPPLTYARNYYLHYPKVALGHWPPFFYLLQAAWTLVFTPSRTSVMLLMTAIAALLSAVLCETLQKEFSLAVGAGAAALFISLPAIEEFSRVLMAEMLVALLVTLAVLAYGRYLDTERWQPAAWFGAWVILAMLTKGSAIQLALVPPFAVLLSGRWYLLRRFSFWLPAILVCAVAGPWYAWIPGAQHESVARFGDISLRADRLTETLAAWAGMLGVVLLTAAVLGLLLCVTRLRRESSAGKWTAGIAVLLGAYVVRLFVGAFEERHLVANLAVLMMFAAAGANWLFTRWWQGFATPKAIFVALSLLVMVGLNIHASPVKRSYGFSEVAERLLSHSEFKGSVFFVCSGAQGEGMLISEVAMREPRPGHIVLRASKMLASSDWMGLDYRQLYHDPNEILQFLESIPVGIVIIDGDGRRSPHGALLYEGLRSHPERWELLASPPGSDILVYRLIGHEGKPIGKIRISMRSAIYGNFSN
jgi:hypothetical protein